MNDDILTRRRQFLASATLGSATLLAGCSAMNDDGDGNETEPLANSTNPGSQDDGDDGTGDGTDGGTDDGQDDWPEPGDGERVVGVVSGVEQQAAQQLQSQLQQGQITQEEYRTQAEQLVNDGLQALRDAVEANTSVTIQDQLIVDVRFVGALRVFGPPAELIDVVNMEDSQSLVSVSSYDELASSIEESA